MLKMASSLSSRVWLGGILLSVAAATLHCSESSSPGPAGGSAGTGGSAGQGGSGGSGGSTGGSGGASGTGGSGGMSGTGGGGASGTGGSAGAGGTGGSAGAGGTAGSGGAGGGTGGSAGSRTDGGAGTGGSAGNGGGGSAPDAGGGGNAPNDGGGPPSAICPGGAYGAPFASANVTATKVKDGFNFVEGPVWFGNLNALFFSDMNMTGSPGPMGIPSVIQKFTPPSTFEQLIPSSNSNGMAIGKNGQILACTHDLQTLSFYDPMTKARTTLNLTYMGKHFNSPNDVTVRSDGHIYFTDPDWQLPPRTSETKITGVYHVAPDNMTVTLVDGALDKPNGITLSPDEKTLYVGSAAGSIQKYAVNADGSTGTGSHFTDSPSPDGMGIDCAGNLYVAGGQTVSVFDATGKKITTIAVPSTGKDTSNVAFGGADRKTLFITHNNELDSIAVNVPGYPY